MEDSDGVASVASVTDSEEEEQKAKERFRDFVKKKGVLTQFPQGLSVVYYSYCYL